MMRFAAHYVYFSSARWYKLHGIELTDDHRFVRVFPLDREMAQTTFYNGVLIVKPSKEGEPDTVEVYCLQEPDLAAAELSADNCGSCSHVQRLC